MNDTTAIHAESRPHLPRGVRLKRDEARGRWTLLAPERIFETRPDYVLILPWNLKDEITSQMAFVREWGGKFIVPIPEPKII